MCKCNKYDLRRTWWPGSTRFRSLPRRVYVTPLCKSPRSKKMWVKPEGNPEMVLEKETLEISYDHMPAPSMRVMDFCTNLLTIDSLPLKRGSNILEKLIPDLTQVDLNCTGCGLSCGLCCIIQVSFADWRNYVHGKPAISNTSSYQPFLEATSCLNLSWIITKY